MSACALRHDPQPMVQTFRRILARAEQGECNWFFDDGDESYDEYRPHDFSSDVGTCVNCHHPKPDVYGSEGVDDEPQAG